MHIEEKIQQWMIEHHKTLALAESITGGAMAARLTAIPGASQYFLGSLVVYSSELKTALLNVSPHTLQQKGAVSAETVQEMAAHLLAVTGADYGIAVSGMAGPAGGTPKTPIGTIWIALTEKGKLPTTLRVQLTGTRAQIISDAAELIFTEFYQYLVQ